VPQEEYGRVAAHFAPPAYEPGLADTIDIRGDRVFSRWVERNVRSHRAPGYRAVVLSLKSTGPAPGDATAEQMDLVADWSERYGFGEVRVTHEQNLVLPDVRVDRLHTLWQELRAAGLATPNIGLLTDIIACPGGDFCSLANAKSIPIAQAIQQRFDDLDYLHDLGEINLNISGCMNSCGHHHVGHIGILGVDKDGAEFYQVSIGGADGSDAGRGRVGIGRIIGPSFAADEIPDVIERLIDVFVREREGSERFADVVVRIGIEPFKQGVYGQRPTRHVTPLAEAA
jgi:sulfite reductase (NADPH) hemoprotein beta-component